MSWDGPECEPNLILLRRLDQLVKGVSPLLYIFIFLLPLAFILSHCLSTFGFILSSSLITRRDLIEKLPF
jgi:hypothetical protein